MIATEQHWLVCYDIEQPRARRKANRLLRQFSLDYQDSGLETRISGDIQPTLQALLPLLQPQDKLLLLAQPHPRADWQLGHPNLPPSADTALLVWC